MQTISGQIDLTKSALFLNSLQLAIGCVEHAANAAGISPEGFVIDGCKCDWNEIDVSEVVDVIDEFASNFQHPDNNNYQLALDLLCNSICERFKEKV